MKAPVGEYNCTRLEKIVFGPGSVARLGHELERRGLGRALIVTGKSLGGSHLLSQVTDALGSRCAGVFKGIAQHVPATSVRALVAEAERIGADVLIAFGGGSPIDAAKVAAASIMNGRDMTLSAKGIDMDAAHRIAEEGRTISLMAVSTTLSAGEFTPGGGVTDEATQMKQGVVDPRLQHRVVIYDPALTLETPEWLWVATAMRALDHAIEGIYSVRHQPFTDTLGSKAIQLMLKHLPSSTTTTGEEALAHRGFCQIAAWHSFFGGFNTRMGISHALGHKIGPKWNVPHGVTSCITLPHVMRFMADLVPERFEAIAEGLGLPFDPADPRESALACADRVAEFIASFDVPHSLKAAGVPRDEILEIAGPVHEEVEHAGVVSRPVSIEEISDLIRAAYE